MLLRFAVTLSLLAGQKDTAAGGDKEEFKCPGEAGTGSFADPKTCRRFYQVRSGKLNHYMINKRRLK